MKNTVMLASILSKMDEEMQKEFMSEITELVKSKAGGLEFGLTAKDVLDGVELPQVKTPEQIESEKNDQFTKSLKDYSATTLEGMKASGINIQEI